MNKKLNKKFNNSSPSDKKIIINNDFKNIKKQDDSQKNLKLISSNIPANGGVKVIVGNKLLEMEKNGEKLMKLEKIIQEQENKIKILNQGVEPYNQEIEKLKFKISQLENENNVLTQKNTKLTLEIDNLKIKIEEEIKIKNELIESNKKLQQKIEILNENLENFKFENQRDQEEYNNMCKVKNNFEDKIIQLSDELDKTKIKLQTAENVIKQKEKYIQMLVNKTNNSTFYKIRNKEQEKQGEQITNINSKRSVRPQSFGIKNRNIASKHGTKNLEINSNDLNTVIIEQENIIKKLKEKIIYLEKDNAGLLIRLKNNSNNLKSIKK